MISKLNNEAMRQCYLESDILAEFMDIRVTFTKFESRNLIKRLFLGVFVSLFLCHFLVFVVSCGAVVHEQLKKTSGENCAQTQCRRQRMTLSRESALEKKG